MSSTIQPRAWILVLPTCLLVLLPSCQVTPQGPQTGRETHWLTGCQVDADCAGNPTYFCVCGVCTAACEHVDDCLGSDTASCVSRDVLGPAACQSTAAAPEPSSQICLELCAADHECQETLGAEYSCTPLGHCTAPHPDPTHDGSDSHDVGHDPSDLSGDGAHADVDPGDAQSHLDPHAADP